MKLNFMKVLDAKTGNDRYGYICDCGSALFQIITPDIIECNNCGLELTGMYWKVEVEDEITLKLENKNG